MSDAEKKMQLRKAELRARRTGDTREYDRLIAEKFEDAKSTAGVMTVLSQVLNNNNGMSAQEKQNITAQLIEGLPAGQRQMIEQMIRTQPAPSEKAPEKKKKKKKRKKKKKKKTLKEDEDEPDVFESKQVDVSLGGVAELCGFMEALEGRPEGPRQMIVQMMEKSSEAPKNKKRKKKKKKKALKEDEPEPDVPEDHQIDVSLGGVTGLSDLMEEDEDEPDVPKDEVNVTLEGVTGLDGLPDEEE